MGRPISGVRGKVIGEEENTTSTRDKEDVAGRNVPGGGEAKTSPETVTMPRADEGEA
jgi:hypothetical protein